MNTQDKNNDLTSNFISTLNNMSNEELKTVVDKVKKMNLDGPTVKELFNL